MRIHELRPALGARKKKVRVGRGIGSGVGKTSGRGQKGQKARSGGGVRRGFEGGQMPLYRRVPKRGFTNKFRKDIVTVNVEQLNKFNEGSLITPETLVQAGIIKSARDGVKILGKGDIKKALIVRAHGFSKQAQEKLAAAGGRAEVI